MKSKERKNSFKITTFWKVSIFFFLFFVLFSFTYWHYVNQVFEKSFRKITEQEFLNNGREISLSIENQLILKRVRELQNLVDILQRRPSRVTSIMEKWLAGRKDIISVTLWKEGQKWPVRIIQNGFWEKPEVKKLNLENRQKLFSILFKEISFPRSHQNSFIVGPISSSDLLGYPILSLEIPFGEHTRMKVLEIKVGLEKIDSLLKKLAHPEETLAILNPSGNVLFSSQINFTVLHSNFDSKKILWEGRNLLGIFSFDHLPWSLYFSKKTLFTPIHTIPLGTFLYPIAGMFFLLILSAIILAKWIDYPVNRLIKSARDIARGNFVLRIPPQKNSDMDRLGRLINYMAEEMSRLQRLDIGDIINEKNKTETILKNIADGVIVTDTQDCILVTNSVAEKWFGLTESETIYKPIRECIKNKPLISLLQEVKDNRLQSSVEFDFRVADTREKKVFQAHAARVHDQEDRLIGVVTVIRDVTKEKEIDRIKTELVSMVAHELKSPLTSIYGFSELLLDSKLNDSQAREYAKIILTESTRLTNLVNKFLDLSRLESGRTELQMNPFDLRYLVEKIIETYKGEAEKKDIKIITEIPDTLPLALGDQDMIEQVLLNLFSNAVKYSPNRSKIGIEAKDEDDKILVSVIDNGYGIPKESLPHVFDKFYRVVDSEGTEEVEGSGLGLALAKEIVERHGGTIKVNSRLGVGSVFSFTVPKATSKQDSKFQANI